MADRMLLERLTGWPGIRTLRELGLCIDRLEAGAEHRHASSRSGGDGCCGRDPDPPREGREPCVRRFHLPAEPPEAARPGLADTFQLGAHLPSADGREADADAFPGHWSGSLYLRYCRLTF